MTTPGVMDEITKYLNKTAGFDLIPAYNMFKIFERLAWLQLYFTNNKNIYTNSMLKFLLSKLKPLLDKLEEPDMFEIFQKNMTRDSLG